MQKSTPTLESLFSEIDNLKSRVATLESQRHDDMTFLYNSLEVIEMTVDALRDKQLPALTQFQRDIVDRLGDADYTAPERLTLVPKPA
jgi:hypothetical protein